MKIYRLSILALLLFAFLSPTLVVGQTAKQGSPKSKTVKKKATPAKRKPVAATKKTPSSSKATTSVADPAQPVAPTPEATPTQEVAAPVATPNQQDVVPSIAPAVATGTGKELVDGDSVKPIFPSSSETLPSLVEQSSDDKHLPAIPYPKINETDVVYRQRVWEEIDSRQKINLPFSPKRVVESPTTLRFVDVLYEGLRTRKIKAYDANDDRLTRILSDEEIANIALGKPDTIEVVDATDPRGLRKIKKIQFNKPDPNNIFKVRLVSDWIFDRINSRFVCRIVALAPILSLYNDAGSYLGDRPLFWIYYPEARDFLNTYKVINWKNYQQSISWQQLFELRYFSSVIIQTTLDNPLGLRLSEYIKDPRERLIEGEKIKNQIFDYEQSMWEY